MLMVHLGLLYVDLHARPTSVKVLGVVVLEHNAMRMANAIAITCNFPPVMVMSQFSCWIKPGHSSTIWTRTSRTIQRC